MRFKTIRQNRYNQLLDSGFLRNEATILSKVPFNVPYMKPLIAERKRVHNQSLRRGDTVGEYEKRIKLKYHAKGWTTYGTMGFKTLRKYDRNAVWKMFQDYESEYKQRHPQYRSPFLNKLKIHKDFQQKLGNSLNKPKKKRK